MASEAGSVRSRVVEQSAPAERAPSGRCGRLREATGGAHRRQLLQLPGSVQTLT